MDRSSADTPESAFGDFTFVSQSYKYRPYYSKRLLSAIAAYISRKRNGIVVADVGAGTGKLVEMFAELGFSGYAIEPNEGMFTEGIRQCSSLTGFEWIKSSAEETGLPNNSVDWISMGSMFHWTNKEASLAECRRILRPGGHLSILYDLTDIDRDPLQQQVEDLIRGMEPNLKRARTPIVELMPHIESILESSGHFMDCIYVEASHAELCDKTRYLAIWDTAHDIKGQISRSRWQELRSAISDLISPHDQIRSLYRTSAWTAEVVQ
ncbi:class I SAM-dependent methyltransferase [Bradyrhizobium valentinum]|uniref:class I SAM-dependent methyltransferase n=1 Tax=Bradyrhizobium valentinum TaxID=1518501 RepID=UPI0007101BF3|nr:methyltransferase domain-containing protein [Bradyrhizobium valentinum]KRR13846.1 hypothetical protein CQ10_38540 [Bradyrhizobium valentinum]